LFIISSPTLLAVNQIRDYPGNKARPRSLLSDCRLVFVFFWRMRKNNLYTIKVCEQVMEKLVGEGVEEIAVYGGGYMAKILYILSKELGIDQKDIVRLQ